MAAATHKKTWLEFGEEPPPSPQYNLLFFFPTIQFKEAPRERPVPRCLGNPVVLGFQQCPTPWGPRAPSLPGKGAAQADWGGRGLHGQPYLTSIPLSLTEPWALLILAPEPHHLISPLLSFRNSSSSHPTWGSLSPRSHPVLPPNSLLKLDSA